MSKANIQWFPGHMHKAHKQIKEVLPQVDIIIEVVDARIPYSSENPLIAHIRENTPCIKVLNKSDLADPEITAQWITYLEQEQGIKALAITTSKPEQVHQITKLCEQMLPHKLGQDKQIRAMIMGIPNVGKSTIINILADRIIAKTGNEPAVTKQQQRIRLPSGIMLSDTPGFLWPKIENANSGYRLAVTGAIKDTAIEYEDIAYYAAEYLLANYPERLKKRYELETLPESDHELMEAIALRRGCLRAGGHFDIYKVSTILLNELRSGALGPLSIETPEMATVEKVAVAALMAEQAENKIEKKKSRKRNYKSR
ncbi:Ras superfamily GTP-binding protein YlqF [Psychromonas ingrahamii 37]|uniref:Ribosome biogenesis GTPase A n=1 Tax=Psychromonas ingrahamii (strain DSM 17664 / CCUG 51855 / 37) TaxID=357804 RepID=A1SXG9_PSYIN|nr:ribosome biogenesis GTPase YlqF [Psychromonas ingrahamii]ABM04184.1 Ras superfamily GTP-binding protein YlqF [Psychromonas ingrahamii 37]